MRRAKYGRGPACVVCGEFTDSVSIRCHRCLDAARWADELGYTRDWLREHPRQRIEVGHDRKGVLHLVLLRLPHLGWCGARVTQVRANRLMAKPGMFPEGMCPECLATYEED